MLKKFLALVTIWFGFYSCAWSTPAQQHLVQFVYNTVANLNYSAYKLGGGKFDTSQGVYIVDCSTYVDNLLKLNYPRAYNSLVNSSGSAKPTSNDYYRFFTRLTTTSKRYWNKIDKVKQLQPGDILVFRSHNSKSVRTRGHVMVVMNEPIPHKSGFLVRVTDSASTGHSRDTREPATSGVGIGTLLLKINLQTGRPSAYAWKQGAAWQKNVVVAMARPVTATS